MMWKHAKGVDAEGKEIKPNPQPKQEGGRYPGKRFEWEKQGIIQNEHGYFETRKLPQEERLRKCMNSGRKRQDLAREEQDLAGEGEDEETSFSNKGRRRETKEDLAGLEKEKKKMRKQALAMKEAEKKTKDLGGEDEETSFRKELRCLHYLVNIHLILSSILRFYFEVVSA